MENFKYLAHLIKVVIAETTMYSDSLMEGIFKL